MIVRTREFVLDKIIAEDVTGLMMSPLQSLLSRLPSIVRLLVNGHLPFKEPFSSLTRCGGGAAFSSDL